MKPKVKLFMPTYGNLEQAKKSISSIAETISKSAYDDVMLYVCDNASNEEMREWFKTITSDKVKVILSDKDVGKATIVNQVYDLNDDCTHMIYVDSNMVAETGYNFIDGMVWCIEKFPEFGLLSASELGDVKHVMTGLDKSVGDETHKISYGKYNSVACDCFIMKRGIWEELGGFNEDGNEGMKMLVKVTKQKKLVGVINTIRLRRL